MNQPDQTHGGMVSTETTLDDSLQLLLIASQSISTEGNFSSTKLPISSNPESKKPKNAVIKILCFHQALTNRFELCFDKGMKRLEASITTSVSTLAPRVWKIKPRELATKLVSSLVISHGCFFCCVESSEPESGPVLGLWGEIGDGGAASLVKLVLDLVDLIVFGTGGRE
ncbi:hypothetical protein IGI04_014007, partial [Brassica rapa subsp. trilocularis]